MSKLLFVGGDFSGIQKFIYNISSKKASVSLKGRSAYLSEELKRICDELIKLPALQKANPRVIYCSGGKFYVITNNSQEITESIDTYRDRVERAIWEEHYGQLGIAIDYLPFVFVSSQEDGVIIEGEIGNIGLLWSKMAAKFNIRKAQKFRGMISQESFFEVRHIGGNIPVCAITGIEGENCVSIGNDVDGDVIKVLPSVKKQIERGEELRKSEGNKSFEEYAQTDNGRRTYLGILRMDIDNLGIRFGQKGFVNLRAYTEFSKHLTDFFDTKNPNSGLMNLRNSGDFKGHLMITYAGGDDLFVVGRWDKVIDFAETVHNKFEQYIGKDGEGLHLSGGVAIVSPKFPIAKAAEMAGEAEEAAKQYPKWNVVPNKNAFTLLGETVGWDNEFTMVRDLKNDLYEHICKWKLSHGVLHQLMRYAEMANEENNMSYIWHSAYYFSRLIERSPEDCKDFIKNLRDNELTRGKRHMQLVALAARWAELELRDLNN